MCSARSRTRPCTSTSPSSAGVSRTATAPGPKSLERQAEARQLRGARGEPRGVGLVELDDLRDQQDLARHAARCERRLQPLIDDALMRGVLVDDDQAVAGLRHDIGLVHLRARGAERAVDQVGRRLEALDARIGRRRADVEGGLRGLGQAERGIAARAQSPAGRAGERRQS